MAWSLIAKVINNVHTYILVTLRQETAVKRLHLFPSSTSVEFESIINICYFHNSKEGKIKRTNKPSLIWIYVQTVAMQMTLLFLFILLKLLHWTGVVFIDIKPGIKIILYLDSYCLQYKEKYLIYRVETANCPKRPILPFFYSGRTPDFKQGTFLGIWTTFPSFPSVAR